MQTFLRYMASRLAGLLAALVLALAPACAQAQPAYLLPQQDLDRMLAPIALYPDAVLSQILIAATYPMQLLEAARWAREHPDLSGDAAVRAAANENWDSSVRSLLAFPQLLARMAENPQWTQALGNAFLAQQSQVMDTVQDLRRRAQVAGNLHSDDRVNVVENGPSLLLQSVDPRVVYVPYYDPMVVYGPWWWPGKPPMYLRPWTGYYARPAYVERFYWGPPIGVSAGIFFGAIDWGRRQHRAAHYNNAYYSRPKTVHKANPRPRFSENPPGAWRRVPEHRTAVSRRHAGAGPRVVATPAPSAPIASRIEVRRPEARFRAHTRAHSAPDRVRARPVVGARFARPPAPPAVGTAAPAHRAQGSNARAAPGPRSAHSGAARMRGERRIRQ